MKHHLASSCPWHFGSSEPKWSKEQIRYREKLWSFELKLLARNYFFHPLPSTLSRTLPRCWPTSGWRWRVCRVLESDDSYCLWRRLWDQEVPKQYGRKPWRSGARKEKGGSVLLECALRRMYLLFQRYAYICIYIRVIYFGTLHLKIGQPTPYSLREKRARFQSLFLEEHGLQLEFITSHEAPNFWYRGMWGGGGRLPGESAGPKAAAVPLSPAPGLRPFAPNVSVSWSA